MAGIAPFLGIIALIGVNLIIKTVQFLYSKINFIKPFNQFLEKISSVRFIKSSVKYVIIALFLVFIFIAPFKSYSIPVPYDHAQVVIKSFS